jgi:hypothetical protein
MNFISAFIFIFRGLGAVFLPGCGLSAVLCGALGAGGGGDRKPQDKAQKARYAAASVGKEHF